MGDVMTHTGTAKNVRTHTQVHGHGGGTAHSGTQVHVSSYEVVTFDLHLAEGAGPPTIPVELVGTRVRFRTIPVTDDDQVAVIGTWKKRREFLRARELKNLTTGVITKGRRFG